MTTQNSKETEGIARFCRFRVKRQAEHGFYPVEIEFYDHTERSVLRFVRFLELWLKHLNFPARIPTSAHRIVTG